ncbi:hypothetical protein DMA10_22820 [Streptomyces sp. WAC 01420]|nr:hypothetical protein DLM49_32160 [Streptomyces sp. WAC 01438]RSM93068.1 hypothetical protein DMA10_22820 [Streptomyces sp. WAC 01420]
MAVVAVALIVFLATGDDDAPDREPTGSPTETGGFPTELPSGIPSDLLPSGFPTELPSGFPTELPSGFPTELPSGLLPSDLPSGLESLLPSLGQADLP